MGLEALKGRQVLFISYNGMLDPLGQTQVLPYLRELAKKGVQFTLLSFEKPYAFEPAGVAKSEELRRELQTHGIDWHWLRYHQRPSLPATMYDVIAGYRKASALIKRKQIEMVHARGHIPGTIALWLKVWRETKLIFDLRGLMAEEYVDAEHWRKGNVPYRITKSFEVEIFAAADAIVTLTERIWPIISEWEGLRGRTPHREVIPCCVDLARFRFSEEERRRRRAELGLDDQFTIVYSGSLDGWYLTDKMADFFASLVRRNPRAHMLWLTTGSHDRVRELMNSRNIAKENFSVLSVAAADVPSYLAAADAGLSFIKRCMSKIASSPTKNAEYLACGLPVIINEGIGDSDALVDQYHAGVLIEEFNETEYEAAAREIEAMVVAPRARVKARRVAKKLFHLEKVGAVRYAALYERVLNS